ncbi:unnamed protein product [Plutella xylostella]|uniref:apyrase n=1 Tax=Plutella xylostella TaxID=51655 RepID=A0A8S4DMY3_PLUXY|nr:unnamed protein product [Plutella xylostella]
MLTNSYVPVLVTIGCVFLGANAFALPFEGLFKLDIIHYNDFHARFEETSVSTATCRFNNNSCLGGFPRLYHEIQALRQEKPDALLLNAGDSFQGTYWYTLLKWNVTQHFMNLLPHDAHAIGNHEFDDGPAGLAPYLSALKAPVLAANMDTSQEPVLQDLYKPSIVVERQGRKIGIIGLITVETKMLSSSGKVVFLDPREVTRREAKALTEQGVDIIVLLSHCGLDVDKELARDYGEHIDVIVGGHTHSLLWAGPAPSGEPAAGPYPLTLHATQGANHTVLVVQASAFTKYMGNLTVLFDHKGEYVGWEGGPIFLDRSIPEDADIKAQLEPYAALVREEVNKVVGASSVDLMFEDCVYGECPLGDIIVDAFNAQAKAKYESKYDYIAIVQRGDIKTSIPAGNITQGDLFEMLPYNDKLETFELAGRHLKQALEHGVSDAWAYKPFKGPWLLQVAGIRVKFDLTKPEGSRVASVTVGDTEPGVPLEDDRLYQVTTASYLAGGGDGFKMLKEHRQNVELVGRDQDVVGSYIRAHSPLATATDGRITITE